MRYIWCLCVSPVIVESAERKQSDIQKLNLKIEQEKKDPIKVSKKIRNN